MEQISRRRATVANLAYQYASLTLGIIGGLILVPLYLRFIDIGLYGAWLASGNTIAWLALMDPGLNELLRQQVAKFYGERNFDQLGRAIGTGWAIMAALAIITVGIGVVLASYMPSWFVEDSGQIRELSLCIFLASVSAALVFFYGAPAAVLQGFQKSGSFTVIYIASYTFGYVLTILLLYRGAGLKSLPIGTVVSGGLMSLFCSAHMLYFAKRRLHIPLRWATEYLNNIKSLIGATFLLQASRILTVNCNEFLTGLLLGKEIVPVVSFTRKLWDLALMFSQRISVAFMPGLAHLWGEGQRRRVGEVAVKMLHVTLWVFGIAAAVILAFNRSFLELWVGIGFFAGHRFNALMALGTFFYVYTYATGQVLYAANDIKSPAVAGVLQSLFRILIIVCFLKIVGIDAIAAATLVSSLAMALIYFRKRFSQYLEIHGLGVEWSGLATLVAAMGVGIAGAYALHLTTWFSLVLSAGCGVAVAGIFLWIADRELRNFVSDSLKSLPILKRKA
jgi:O-antigen/teichoic acid export membrane protein